MKVVEMTPKEFATMMNQKNEKEEFLLEVDLSKMMEKKYPLSDGSLEESVPSAFEKAGDQDG